MREQVEVALEQIKPFLLADGGNVELVDVNENGVVKLKLIDACYGCHRATITLRQDIERVIGEGMPQIEEVIAV